MAWCCRSMAGSPPIRASDPVFSNRIGALLEGAPKLSPATMSRAVVWKAPGGATVRVHPPACPEARSCKTNPFSASKPAWMTPEKPAHRPHRELRPLVTRPFAEMLVLSDIPWLAVRLPHDESRIRHIYLRKRAPMNVSPLLTHQPVRFTSYLYIPESIDRHGFVCSDPAQSELARNAPLVTNFKWSDQMQSYEQAVMPDSLVIAATPQRMADLGALLIDFGREESTVSEIAMESALDGAGGVSHGSVEQKFWLPGSPAFPEPGLYGQSLPLP